MRWVLAAGAALPAPLFAQFSTSGANSGMVQALPAPPSNDPADRLAANLQVLARNPRDLFALREAGKSAIAVGDGNAALSFLARAEDLSPSDPSIKADLGSALVLIEQPDEALKLFDEAAKMGYPERLMARDRGLAFDLTGDSRRAQRDYTLAQRQGGDDELTRRLALSLGISGDRDAGLKLLDPLLRKQDQGAWRARAFILAMNGNLKDAERIVDQVMPAGMSLTMTPFLRRLASLTPMQRARAVNFGSMPDAGIRTAMIAPDQSFRPLDAGTAGRLMPADPPPAAIVATEGDNGRTRKPSRAPRRRPGRDEEVAAISRTVPSQPSTIGAATTTVPSGRIDTRLNTRIAPVDPERLPPEVRDVLYPKAGASTRPETKLVLSTQTSLPSPYPTAVPPPPPPIAAAPNKALAPVFEIPVATVAKTSPPPVAIRPATMPPGALPFPSPPPPVIVRPVTVPAATAAAPPPPVLITVSPPPPPAVRIMATPSPAPPPVSVAVSPPPAPVIQQSMTPQIAAVQPPSPGFSSAPPPPYSQAAPSLGGLAPAPLTSTPLPTTPTPTPSPALVAGPSRVEAGMPPSVGQTQPSLTVVTPTPPVKPALLSPVPATASVPRLASILADVVPEEESRAAPLPTLAQLKAARLAAQKKTAAEATAKAEKDAKLAAAAEAAAKAKRNPARVWVQVATGNNEAGLSGTWKRLREKAPDVFKGQSASVVPYKATNRVLVGPFKSQAEARALVNSMGKAGIQGSTYSSDAGQEVARIGGK